VPERFASSGHARVVFRDLFHWYNHQHRHSGIAYLTPFAVQASAYPVDSTDPKG
jgi:transposase InsO family protein